MSKNWLKTVKDVGARQWDNTVSDNTVTGVLGWCSTRESNRI